MQRKRFPWADAGAIVLLCLLSVVFYRHIALSNRILSGGDAFTYFYPYRAYAAETIRGGSVPLWNPYLFLGVPFLANPQAAVFYPLNLALCWLSAPKLLAWSIVVHTALAAAFAYLYARHTLRLSPLPALLGASAFAFGGFLSGQAEHINQLNVSAWFPLLLLLWDLRQRQRARWLALLGLGVTVGLGLLAGHTQASYISLFGLGVYALLPALPPLWSPIGRLLSRQRQPGPGPLRGVLWAAIAPALQTLLELGLVCLVGLALAAVQIVPTLELARLSIRGGGLEYRQAVAFSLKPLPRLLRYTFLPPWGADLATVFGGSYFTEYLAYVGLLPLVLAGVWCVDWLVKVVRGHPDSLHEVSLQTPSTRLVLLGGLGILLAVGLYNPLYWVLYRVVPGFALFRVPARWLFLYALSAAMLAGAGLELAGRWLNASPPLWKRAAGFILAGVLALALAELVIASGALPFSHPIAPEAFASLRTAPAHIRAAQEQSLAPGRFLSLSDILFDPGDLGEIRGMLQGHLSEPEIYDYVVATKRKEIIAPNLPLVWRMYAVDGYDGGLLPLARYIYLQRLFLDEEEILVDGRLREGLERIPPSRLLSILGTRYVITDKVHDVWIDDVFYDLAFEATLAEGTATEVSTTDIPAFAATGIGVVSYLEGARSLADGTAVAEVRLYTETGETHSFTLRAGQDTAEGLYDGDVAHSQARVGHTWRDRPEGSDYVTRLDWETPARIARIEVGILPFGGRVHVRGLTLVDRRDGSNVPLTLSTDGQFRQVHSGDVKIYEALDALPRAYVVHQAHILDDEAAIAAMADPAFSPSQQAILSTGQALHANPARASQVTVTEYRPERVTIRASTAAPGYLILSDAWYPGWRAMVDGQAVDIVRANVHFRAVYLDAGQHTLRFLYQPTSYYVGLGVSATAALAVVLLAIKRCNPLLRESECTRRSSIADV
jgi:hypothetical protein